MDGFIPSLIRLTDAAAFAPVPVWQDAARSVELCLTIRRERGVARGAITPFDRHDANHAAVLDEVEG